MNYFDFFFVNLSNLLLLDLVVSLILKIFFTNGDKNAGVRNNTIFIKDLLRFCLFLDFITVYAIFLKVTYFFKKRAIICI